ncbi:MAG: hypothetical protein QFF03_13075 [Pseudomonadota bacterium]|nr:hypothetical protein [Pseudomonadota bacterium]
MNAGCVIAVDTDTLGNLINHLRDSGSELSLAEVASQAIRWWLRAQAGAPDADAPRETGQRAERHAADAGCRGYQWKELFLPEGCALRMCCAGQFHHARVDGDAIVYQGRSCSPRQLTIAIAGDGRNAWRDLWVRFPGEKQYRPASLLRRKLRASVADDLAPDDPAKNRSPAAVIGAAAAAMSEALRTALALVDHSNAQALPKYERRLDSQRRALDVLAGQVMLD